jgi:hypothetical protein
VRDTVSLSWGKLKVDDQHFALCHTYVRFESWGETGQSPISGMLGMGIPDPSFNQTPWFWNLIEDGQLQSPVFSFYIPPHDLAGGQVTIGGVDESKFEGDIAWTDLNVAATNGLREYSSYMIDQTAIYANGKMISGNMSDRSAPDTPLSYAILDTGTAFIQTPSRAHAKDLYAKISPSIAQLHRTGAWGAPCDLMESIAPELTFTLGTGAQALNLTIPKEYFNVGEFPNHPGLCQALFNTPTTDSFLDLNGTDVWIVGSPLLDKYYTVWDGVGMRIGWGKLPGLPDYSESHAI